MNKKKILGVLLVAVVCLAVVVAPVTAQSSPFVIDGWVTAKGEPCNNSCVAITNTNTSECWHAENNSDSNYYQLMLNGGENVSTGDLLRFNVSGCNYTKTEEHTVTQDELDNGGFMLNISLVEPQELIWQGDITLVPGATCNVTAHNSGESYVINQTTALGALDAAAEKGDFNYTVSDEWYVSLGLFVDSIADIQSEGWDGWMYWVNYPEDPMPMVGINQYKIKDGDVVTLYWSSNMNMMPADSPKLLIINVPVCSVFDTGKGTYPSISGTHYGTIIAEQNISVNRIYTYPCAGTGGHTEYVKIWNETRNESVVAEWNGYTEDYHNLSFDTTLTLKKDVIYNYTITTGSYPQIIHVPYKQVTGGNITCTRFEDVNGKEYENWLPAFRLWYAPTIHVPADYDTIQEAINHSSPGTTIIVSPKSDTDNVYNEHIEINESLSDIKLIANGEVVIRNDASGASTQYEGDQITVLGEGCTIQGFEIINGWTGGTYPNYPGAGLRLCSGNNTVRDNHIYNTSGGIVLEESSHNTIENNTIRNTLIMMAIWGDYNIIADNTFGSDTVSDRVSSWRLGGSRHSYDKPASYNIVRGNTFVGHTFLKGSDNQIYNNKFSGSNEMGINNTYNITRTSGTNIVGGQYLGGNYWSEYKGTDTDEDGIGDTAYEYDQLPLVMM